MLIDDYFEDYIMKKEKFELAFNDMLEANEKGEVRNLLITDSNAEFLDNALYALRSWAIDNGMNLVELDEKDDSWLPEIYSRELFSKLNQPNTVLLVKNYATAIYKRSDDETPRNFLRDAIMNRCYRRGNYVVPFPNLMFVVVLNDLSEMKWWSREYITFSVIHQDDTKKVWINKNFTLLSSKMYPMMSAVNKVAFWVSEDETTLCVEVGEAFKGVVALRDLSLSKRPTMDDKTEIIHTYIESRLPVFHDKVVCLILKMTKAAEDEPFVVDGRRLRESFPNLGTICCKENFEIADMDDEMYILDPFDMVEMSFNLALDGDIPMANAFLNDLWALDHRWARFLCEVARDYCRKPEDHSPPDANGAVHNWTGMDHLFHIYLLGWYHAGDDFFDEEDKVYVSAHKDLKKAIDLLPIRFRNCSVDEVADKLYWDIRHLKKDIKPDYLLFAQVLEASEKICPGVLAKMRDHGWVIEEYESYFPI